MRHGGQFAEPKRASCELQKAWRWHFYNAEPVFVFFGTLGGLPGRGSVRGPACGAHPLGALPGPVCENSHLLVVCVRSLAYAVLVRCALPLVFDFAQVYALEWEVDFRFLVRMANPYGDSARSIDRVCPHRRFALIVRRSFFNETLIDKVFATSERFVAMAA